MSKKIYVNIASYRDPGLSRTINDLYEKASHPERVYVGCFIQANADEVSDMVPNNDWDGRVKVAIKEPGEIYSVTKCRNLANEFLDNTFDYVLQIDAHNRFEDNWDSYLVDHLESYEKHEIILSSTLPAWEVDDTGCEILRVDLNDHLARVHTFQSDEAKQRFLDSYELCPTTYWHPDTYKFADRVMNWNMSGHFIFTHAEYFLEVPQPEWVYFWSEEVLNGLIAFTRGWDIYVPKYIPVYHQYPQNLHPKDSVRGKRNKLFYDFPESVALGKATTDRTIDIILNNTVGEGALFGKRPLTELYEYLGYNLGELLDEWRKAYRRYQN